MSATSGARDAWTSSNSGVSSSLTEATASHGKAVVRVAALVTTHVSAAKRSAPVAAGAKGFVARQRRGCAMRGRRPTKGADLDASRRGRWVSSKGHSAVRVPARPNARQPRRACHSSHRGGLETRSAESRGPMVRIPPPPLMTGNSSGYRRRSTPGRPTGATPRPAPVPARPHERSANADGSDEDCPPGSSPTDRCRNHALLDVRGDPGSAVVSGAEDGGPGAPDST
jgi:hypothetical protein